MSVFSNRPKRVGAMRSTAIFGGMPKADLEALDRHVTGMTSAAATVIAQTKCDALVALVVLVVLVVLVNKLTTMLEDSTAFARKLLKSLAGRLRETHSKLG